MKGGNSMNPKLLGLRLDLRVTEKFTFEGFDKASPKIYKDVTKLIKIWGDIYIYRNDECIDCICEFYYKIEVIKSNINPALLLKAI